MGDGIYGGKRTQAAPNKKSFAAVSDSSLRRKPYDQITIRDICEQAGTYRSTFYRYYNTKDEMLREIEHTYIAETHGLTPSIRTFHADASPEEYERCLSELTADMEYHRTHRKICEFLLSPGGDIYFYEKMLHSIMSAARENCLKQGKQMDGINQYLYRFFAAGFVAAIYEWLKSDDYAPVQMAEILLKLTKQFLTL